MPIIEKEYLSKLLEIYRAETYAKDGDALFSKTKFGFTMHNANLVTICSFHTYQKLLETPLAIKDKVYLQLLDKFDLRYEEGASDYFAKHMETVHALYHAFLYLDYEKIYQLCETLLKPLSSDIVFENEYRLLIEAVQDFHHMSEKIDIDILEHFLHVSFLFPDELQILLYDLCFRSYYKYHLDMEACKKVLEEVQKRNLASLVLDIDLLIYDVYTVSIPKHIYQINALLDDLLKNENYNRSFDVYVMKLNYVHENNEDDSEIYQEVEQMIKTKPVHPKKKFAWLINTIIHSFDHKEYDKVIQLFEGNFLQTKVPIIAVLLYYSASNITKHPFQIISQCAIMENASLLYVDLKTYFEYDLPIYQRERRLFSFFKEISYDNSILNQIIYNEFALYYKQFSKGTLLRFIEEIIKRKL